MTPTEIFQLVAGNLVALWAALFLLWGVSVRIKDASIIDIFWGPACAFGAVATLIRVQGQPPRDLLLVSLACLWAARLFVHLARRNLGHGEDYRYQAMRKKAGSDAAFARRSLMRVFALQGLIAWFVSLPVQLGQIGGAAAFGVFSFAGILVFGIGLAFETIGDAQLRAFKADPANKGKLMTTGLWAWTRHPNYFGDAAVWTGLTLIALEGAYGWATILSPLVMAHFLINISGKALLERGMDRKYPGYAVYRQKTSGFFPLPPERLQER